MESGTRYVLLIRTKTRLRFITTILVKTSGTLCLSSKQNAIQVNPPSPLVEKPWKGRVYGCALPVSCKLYTKTHEKGEVPQNLLVRIVAS